MVADFNALATSIVNGSRDTLLEAIRDKAETIASEINKHGFYEDRDLGFKVSIDLNSNRGK